MTAALPPQPWMQDPATKAVMTALANAGGSPRFVGGCVRDTLVGRAVADIDIATPLTPPAVIAALEAADLRAVPTGIEHGTVTAISGRRPFEVTTLRRDVETDGRRAVVAFTTDWAEDAQRRDFRLNALYLDPEGRLYDPTGGGVADAHAGRIVFVGDARTRIREDYLRILRFFRFHAAYGEGAMNREAFEAAISEHAGIERLSRERVRSELLKLLAAKRCADVIGDVAGAGILGPILAGVAHPGRLANLVRSGSDAGDPVLRLAALGLLIEEDADRLLDHLRLSNAERDRLAAAARALAKLHAPDSLDEKALRALLYRHGRQALLDALRLASASDDRDRSAALAFVQAEPLRKLPLGGADLIRRGMVPGPALGAALAEIEQRWVEADFPADGATLEALVASTLATRT